MKGNNSMVFNTATMIEIVQEYLNAHTIGAMTTKVTGFKKTPDTYGCDTFTVDVCTDQDEAVA